MLDKDTLVKLFSSWISYPNAHDLADHCLNEIVYLGKEMYVVSQYLPSLPYQVVKVTVTKMKYDPRKDKKYFSVEGRWGNGNYYNGTFNAGSISKTIFNTFSDAEELMNVKNNRREKNGK